MGKSSKNSAAKEQQQHQEQETKQEEDISHLEILHLRRAHLGDLQTLTDLCITLPAEKLVFPANSFALSTHSAVLCSIMASTDRETWNVGVSQAFAGHSPNAVRAFLALAHSAEMEHVAAKFSLNDEYSDTVEEAIKLSHRLDCQYILSVLEKYVLQEGICLKKPVHWIAVSATTNLDGLRAACTQEIVEKVKLSQLKQTEIHDVLPNQDDGVFELSYYLTLYLGCSSAEVEALDAETLQFLLLRILSSHEKDIRNIISNNQVVKVAVHSIISKHKASNANYHYHSSHHTTGHDEILQAIAKLDC